MAKFLVRGTYTASGAAALHKEGGSARRAAVEKAVRGLGGTVEAYYYAFGDHDVYIIVDMPDNKAAVAASLVTNASGAVSSNFTVLITPEEVDEAVKLSVDYRPPGQ